MYAKPHYRPDSRLRLLCNNMNMLFLELVQLQVHYGQHIDYQQRRQSRVRLNEGLFVEFDSDKLAHLSEHCLSIRVGSRGTGIIDGYENR